MQSRYGVMWVRHDGARVPVEQLLQEELREARLSLLRQDLDDPLGLALFDAVSAELARRSGADQTESGSWPMAA